MRSQVALLFLLMGCRDNATRPPETTVVSRSVAAPAPAAAPARSRSNKAATRAPRVPALPAAAFAWSFADTVDSPTVWTVVAENAQRELAACKTDCREVMYQVVLARNHAVRTSETEPPPMDAPAEPMPADVQASVAALDTYVAMLDPADDEVAPMTFLAAASLWRWRDPGAIARLEAVLRDHRDDETAEYAANQLLDLLLREKRFAALRAWTAELSSDETFLANKPDLRETLEHLRQMLATLPP